VRAAPIDLRTDIFPRKRESRNERFYEGLSSFALPKYVISISSVAHDLQAVIIIHELYQI